MNTRDLAGAVTAILNFQNGRHWKLKICITLLYMWIFANVCIDGQLYTESYQVCGHITWFCNSLH